MSETSLNQDTKRYLSWGAVSFIEAASSRILAICVLTILSSLGLSLLASFFIKIDVSTKANGQTESLLGVKEAVSQVPGQLYYFPVKEGDSFKKDQVLGWVRIEGSHEAEMLQLVGEANEKISGLDQKNTLRASSVFKTHLPENLNIKNLVSEAEKRQSAWMYYLSEGTVKAQAEIQPILKRVAVVKDQLQYIKKSPMRQYLEQQRIGLEEEVGRLQQQITVSRNAFDQKLIDLKSETKQSLQAVANAVQNLIQTHQIKSPCDGRVAKIWVNEGQLLADQQPVVSILPLSSSIVAKVSISSEDRALIKVGQSALVSIDAYPSHKFGYFQGKVLSIDQIKTAEDKSNPDGYVARLSVNIDHPVRQIASLAEKSPVHLVPGMKVEARIISKRASLISLGLDKIFGKDQ
jgi:multidrug efflux pump subunit AcrA (membrane-fusion protein)